MPPMIGAKVWKIGASGGYEGPGEIVAIFKNWMGQERYVVAHQIGGGNGYFYHIYSKKELELMDDKGERRPTGA
jgi:hypothetical protein